MKVVVTDSCLEVSSDEILEALAAHRGVSRQALLEQLAQEELERLEPAAKHAVIEQVHQKRLRDQRVRDLLGPDWMP